MGLPKRRATAAGHPVVAGGTAAVTGLKVLFVRLVAARIVLLARLLSLLRPSPMDDPGS